MKFTYKGQKYDTDKPQRIQLTEDRGLMMAVINKFYGDSTVPDWTETETELRFQLALMSVRYSSILRRLTGDELSIAGTYPDWVIEEVEAQHNVAVRDDIEDIIGLTTGRDDLIAKLRQSYPEMEK